MLCLFGFKCVFEEIFWCLVVFLFFIYCVIIKKRKFEKYVLNVFLIFKLNIIFFRSYKELMIKCNFLGRGEVRFVRKFEKVKEKIIKFKVIVFEFF